MKRLGLIGVGAWGRRYIDTIRRRGDCRIDAVARNEKTSDVPVPSAEVCADWRDLVDRAAKGSIDGVITATTPEHQLEVAIECIERGVPLLVEKPLGLSADAADRARRNHERSARHPPILVDYIHLWAPAYLELSRRVASDLQAGNIAQIVTEGFNWGPRRTWSSLYDYGPHDIAMVLALWQRPVDFELSSAHRIPSQTDGFELFDAHFRLDGVPIHISVGNGGAAKVRKLSVVVSTGKTIVYDDTRPPPFKLVDGDTPVPVGETSPLDEMLSAFLRSVDAFQAGRMTKDEAGASLALSARVNTILDAILAPLERR
jgi:predicted dehydrogenase